MVNVGQRANLYKTIKRLHQDGLIAVHQTERDHQFPERTVYELTDEGRRVAREWLIGMLETPRNEFPGFPAALSFIMLLSPDQSLPVLERRAALLYERLAEIERELAGDHGHLPRVTLLESEYLRAVTEAEVRWVQGVIGDLRTGALTWADADFAAAMPD